MLRTNEEYDLLLNLVKYRMSVRRLKPDPIPDESVDKILEVARWAMSGANSQPWEFIVVKDPAVKKALGDAYRQINMRYIFWMEQQRIPDLRHPSFHVPGDSLEQLDTMLNKPNFDNAPVLIVVLGDGRRQWGTVMGAHTFGRDQSHLTDGLANASFLIHLTAASLGLGSQWLTIHIQEPFKKILGVPDLLTLYLIIPIGYPSMDRQTGNRRELSEIVHYDHYDMSKYMSDEQVLEYLYHLRKKTVPRYAHSYNLTGGQPPASGEGGTKE